MIIGKREYFFLRNFFQISKFLIKKRNCKILYFKLQSDLLVSFLDVNFFQVASDKINLALNNDPQGIKKLIKLGWLIDDIRKRQVKNPLQLLYVGNGKYFCHPGTDRALATLYIDPVECVEGFYIWYPDIDPDPFILNYEHEEIKDPFTLMFKFKSWNGVAFDEIKLNKNINITDNNNQTIKRNLKGSYPHFSTALYCFKKTEKDFDFPFLTYIGMDHWTPVEEMQLSDVLDIEDEDTVFLSGIKFIKKNDVWIKDK